MPAQTVGDLHDFVEGVVPELQRRGLFRKAYEGKTLRDHLNLPKPAGKRSHKTITATADTALV
jgi:hypothetical protein